MKRKIRLVSFKVLYKKTWDKMSLFVRNRDNWTCITCKTHLPGLGNGIQAGHYIHMNCYDFNEKAVNAQCSRCNCKMRRSDKDGGEMVNRYAEELDKKHGEGTAQSLRDNRHQIVKWCRSGLLEKCDELDNKLSLLITDKLTGV